MSQYGNGLISFGSIGDLTHNTESPSTWGSEPQPGPGPTMFILISEFARVDAFSANPILNKTNHKTSRYRRSTKL